jgi:glucan-binding YG repeat protein
MVSGWRNLNGTYYFFDASGAMVKNRWIGNYYLLGDGTMAKNQWIGSYYVGSDGCWR